MPIAVRVVSDDDYKNWVSDKQKSTNLQTKPTAAADPGAPVRR